MIYLISFGLSALFANQAMKASRRNVFIFFSVLSIGVTVLLAGLRDFSIGIDVTNYMNMNQYWKGAVNYNSLFEYLKYYASRGLTEYLFAIFIGLIAQITGNYRVFLFLAHIIIISGVYIGAFRQRKYANPILVLFLFYLFFYNHSLNIIRQYMAMAIVFAAMTDIYEKKYVRYGIVVLIASLIHTSALISLGLLMIYYVLYDNNKLKHATLPRKLFIAMMLLILLAVLVPLVQFLVSNGILNSKYLYYLDSDEATPTTIVSLLLILELFAIFLFRKSIRRDCIWSDFYIMCTIAYLILQQTASFIAYGKRIAAYYSLVNIVSIGVLQKSQKGKGDNYLIITIVIIAVALMYWAYMYVYRGASQTFPYKFG